MNANNLKNGDTIIFENQIYSIIKPPEHTKPGKGKAYIQVEMKNILHNTKINRRFSATEQVEKAFLEQKKFLYLYKEQDQLIFMEKESYEQIEIMPTLLGKKIGLLSENMEVVIEFWESKAITIELPPTVIMQIQDTEPVIKGATITSSYKTASLENNVQVQVPSYLSIDDKVIIKTSDITFVSRYKDE